MPQIWFSPWRLSARISRAWNSGELASLYRYLPRRPARLAGWLLLTMRDAALDWGNFCVGFLTKGLEFVGIPQ